MNKTRCANCRRLLAVVKKTVASGAIEIKCPRCKTVNKVP
ncbi:MAG: Com family DNA-binding transcriptional regulator [Nitrospinae bacterium]|nr:Com family DNA-binding transcriptional regulator [Nitrospinota bacterium]